MTKILSYKICKIAPSVPLCPASKEKGFLFLESAFGTAAPLLHRMQVKEEFKN